jgi:TRAP-type uncharacterized transport system fused permease subunit
VAAAIARADWLRTGFIAVRLGLPAFIVPYMFVFAPALLWHGSWIETVWAAVSACIGVIALSAGTMGFLRRPATWPERVALIVAALLLIKPGIYTDLLGLAIGAAVLAVQRLSPGPRRRTAEA